MRSIHYIAPNFAPTNAAEVSVLHLLDDLGMIPPDAVLKRYARDNHLEEFYARRHATK